MLFPYSCKRSTVHFARAPSSPPSTQGLRWLSPSIRSRGKNLGSFCIIHFPEQGKLQGISQNRANFQVQTGRFELIKQALTRRIPYGVETGKFFVVIREIIAEDQGILVSFAQRDQNQGSDPCKAVSSLKVVTKASPGSHRPPKIDRTGRIWPVSAVRDQLHSAFASGNTTPEFGLMRRLDRRFCH